MKSSGKAFANRLLAWWDVHGRHDLPWQQNPTAYRVWVSEIMLQQTQVSTVERYYPRFMQSFPVLRVLADASQDAVLHHWSGLGYYSRARNLHKAAQQVVAAHKGELPGSIDELMALPGIGRSTAGAILSLVHDQRHSILDGNAKRVLARHSGLQGWPGTTANLKRLWELADNCTPATRVGNYTQAIMDLGATLCTRSRPRCTECPLHEDCVALTTNQVASIPASKPKKSKPHRTAVLVLARRQQGEVLLEKRPPQGIWGGLWSLPQLDSRNAVEDWCVAHFGSAPQQREEWPAVAHSFSHFDLTMTPVEISVQSPDALVMEANRWLWYNTREPQRVGLAAPVARLLEKFRNKAEETSWPEQ